MRIIILLKVYKNGKLVLQQPSKCLLSNFRNSIYLLFTTHRACSYNCYSEYKFSVNAPDNDDSYGIVVGSGAMPVTPDDTSLSEKITHGTGTGQLDYDPTEVSYEVDYTNKRGYIYVKRSFKNLSDSDVIVRECGIVAWFILGHKCRALGEWRIDEKRLIVRDVLSEPVTVHPYEQLVIHYTFQIG